VCAEIDNIDSVYTDPEFDGAVIRPHSTDIPFRSSSFPARRKLKRTGGFSSEAGRRSGSSSLEFQVQCASLHTEDCFYNNTSARHERHSKWYWTSFGRTEK
jgi:hypothetical protein